MSDTRENDKLSLCSPFDIVSHEKEENYKKEIKRLQKQLEIAKSFIFRCANDIAGDWYVNAAKCVWQQIEELNK